MSGKLDWENARARERRRQQAPPSRVLGSRTPVAPPHKHTFSDWESPPGTYATIARFCTICGHTERGKLVLSDIAQTATERKTTRAQARRRRGHALNPEGQLQLLYKQRRQNVRD